MNQPDFKRVGGLKILGAIILLLTGCITFAKADSIQHSSQKQSIYDLERTLQKRKRKLDSSLRITDAYLDSITGNEKEALDTLQMLYLLEAKKEREQDEDLMYWMKVGVLTFIIGLGFGFYVWKRKRSKTPS